MATRKKAAGRNESVEVCPACRSPALETALRNGREVRVCERCGYVTDQPARRPVAHARAHAKRRQVSVKHAHVRKRYHDARSFNAFLERYSLRAWFKVVGVMLFCAGVVLLPTEQLVTGVLFVVCGASLLFAGLKWL
ncbi:zf-TFIIB domain-containing protein [Candidatus Woesearchaeota archaeon]|nr:zf-TFIIB domain-containing protein [Candidatus Woesearchaeota archaeon]